MFMETKTASELMIPLDKYPHIPYWFTVRQAIALIQHSELVIDGKKSLARAVLVFDEEYQLLGMIRRRDIITGIDPKTIFGNSDNMPKGSYAIEIDPNLLEISYEKLVNVLRERAERPVSDVMIPIEHAVEYNDHLIKIIFEMNHHHFSMMPVTKDGAVIGVIRTVEVISELSKILDIS
jgi:Mg/Co/Ni transporter MgtE